MIVGATDYCTHPADLDVARVRGTKNPDLERIRELAPDVVLANAEENRAVDLDALRASGIAVWATAPTTVAESLRLTRPDAVRDHRRGAAAVAGRRAVWSTTSTPKAPAAVVPIWRRPWMALDGQFAVICCRIGVDNVLRDSR